MSADTGPEASPGPAPSDSGEGASYHFADITPEQAGAINDNFNIVAYGGVHGCAAEAISELGYCPPGFAESVEMQCQAISDMVGHLDPERGDVLFMENMGHDGLPINDGVTDPETYRGIIEEGRREQRIDPFFYATALAQLKGIPVISADMTSDTVTAFEQVTGILAEQAIDLDSPFREIYQTLREEQAANTVKDYALSKLSTTGAEKPTYALLMGADHLNERIALLPGESKGIAMAFSRLGLNTQIKFFSDPERDAAIVDYIREAQEQRIARNMAPLIGLLTEMRTEDGKSYR